MCMGTDTWRYRPLTTEQLQGYDTKTTAVSQIWFSDELSDEITLLYLNNGLIPDSYWNENANPLESFSEAERRKHTRKFRKLWKKAKKYASLYFPDHNRYMNEYYETFLEKMKEEGHKYTKTERKRLYAEYKKSKRETVYQFLFHQALEEIGYRYVPNTHNVYIGV